ncbi:MAG: NupC/NupG family nucleoside CNT transporter [Spirochaetes bacterium]|nr:NupC/NupG family nucleoside CNT transporter [Spirochaetota bacterium]
MNTLLLKGQSLAGLLILLIICFLLSEKRKSIKIRTILWGIGLQVLLAIIILKTSIGFMIFHGADKVFSTLIKFSDKGASFVFGSLVSDRTIGALIAFRVLPIIIYVSALMGVLYYFRIIQFFVKIMARIMYYSMKISGAESFGSALLIFMGIESSTAIKEYIKKMTRSELFTYISAFMATIASSVMLTYISFGASAGHLLAASIMSAPAAIAISKILIPETEKPETMQNVSLKIKKTESNMIEAVANGASTGAHLAIQVGAMILGFVGIIFLLDGLLGYAGLSLNQLFGYIFYPFALMIGIPVQEAPIVARLLGVKTVFNEFLAYHQLQSLIQTQALSARSIAISTYALCGFANFGSIGILIGGIGSIAPGKKSMVASLGIKALIAGTFASFLTAIIAGLLI